MQPKKVQTILLAAILAITAGLVVAWVARAPYHCTQCGGDSGPCGLLSQSRERTDEDRRDLQKSSVSSEPWTPGQHETPRGRDATDRAVLRDGESAISFETYSGYFVSNKFEPDAADSFAVLRSQAEFDRVFGVAMVMGDKSHRLASDAFGKHIVVAAIKRGDAVWEFRVEGVDVREGVVRVRYRTSRTKSETASFACPLILSIPKGDYRAVVFIENQKTIKQLSL